MTSRAPFFIPPVLLLVLSLQVQGQCGQDWEWQHPFPQGNYLNGIESFDQDTTIAVGGNATIIRTYDGGTSWEKLHCATGSEEDLEDIDMIDEKEGWAVGDNATVLHTTDGGDTWSSQTPGNIGQDLLEVTFVDSMNGWACSPGGIFHTNDGGNSWSSQSFPSGNSPLSIHFTDTLHGWCVGRDGTDGVVLHTSNGGNTWSVQTNSVNWELHSVHFIDSLRGWAVGEYGTVIHTDDGGSSWNTQSSGFTDHLTSVQFLDSSKGWVCGLGEMIAHTSDGGTSWNKQIDPNTSRYLNDLHFTDTAKGWAAGSGGSLMRTTNGGSDWDSIPDVLTRGFTSSYFLDSLQGWALSRYSIFRTVDGGDNWDQKQLNTGEPLNAVHFSDTSNGWVVGNSATLLHTDDGGNSWSSQYHPGTYQNLNDLHFVDSLRGWVVGNGVLYHTPDGGSNWNDLTFNGLGYMDGVHFVNATHGWIVGNGSEVWHTEDGGASWDPQIMPTTGINLEDVHFPDLSHGWAVGVDKIYHTDNGGDDWSIQKDSLPLRMKSVHFVDKSTGFALSNEGALYTTSDGGNNWDRQHVGANVGSVFFTCHSVGWVVGAGILHHSGECTKGFSSIEDTACDSYTVPSGDETYTSSGLYTDTITKCGGCDSVIDIDLTIAGITNPSVNTSSDTLIAQDTADSYQWVDCESGHAPIPGATDQVYVPNSNGVYAVVLSENGCSDTSSCRSLNTIGIEEEEGASGWSVTPNPSQGQVQVELGEHRKELRLTLTDMKGRELLSKEHEDGTRFTLEWEGEAGIYFLRIEAGEEDRIFRLVKE